MSYTTTSYGTWCNRVNSTSTSPDSDVLDYINGGDNAWQERLHASGAVTLIQSEYRDAINAALPDSVSLCGDEFIGPADPEDDEFEGYPTDEYGTLDFATLVEDINLEPIVDRNDPLTLEEIGRWEMKSTAKEPAKVASMAMKRAGLKPHVYLPHPESNRPQAIFLKGAVVTALTTRPRQASHSNAARNGDSATA
ncbi:hypothetical protein [Streptomyces poriferorum]|uniref:Uncharacterized protein n=1 Tax=Streptomyces poriferorum TaxID=2798799 RepID=A0ABY9IYC3_9ACTN|nr:MULTISPECIES: hypothetical protein [unclassified Streptomyces]MDP5310435.1 hypothetical protein [Streptomyces sp. Alt4]WLQ60411.1 hypothetical protein P8A19_35530 [Streptomyces sp. Alt2]